MKILTERENDYLKILSLKVRVLSEEQLKLPKIRLRWLTKAGLVNRYRVNVYPILKLDRPLVSWQPGDPLPDLVPLATMLKKRWRGLVPRTATVYTASGKTRNIFAGIRGGKLKQAHSVTHDLHVSEVYLKLRRTQPKLASQWLGEDIYSESSRGMKLPDAMLFKDGSPLHVVELAGSYGIKHLTSFYKFCRQERLSSDLW